MQWQFLRFLGLLAALQMHAPVQDRTEQLLQARPHGLHEALEEHCETHGLHPAAPQSIRLKTHNPLSLFAALVPKLHLTFRNNPPVMFCAKEA
eukprot:4053847-Amphidinium_carterae.1